MTIEQLIMMQTQVLQGVAQAVQALQQVQQQPVQVQVQAPPWERHGEFLKSHPPTFSYASEPIQAEDWLRAVERDLQTAQCTDQEMVMYGSRQLQGPAQEWWEAYLYAHAARDTITWQEFKDSFCAHHVSEGTMIRKREEFLALKQGAM